MRLKLTIAYDGTGFRGWARQPGERTVEGELADGARAPLRVGRGRSPSPGARTRACTRSRTSSRSTSRAARRRRARGRGAQHGAARRHRGRRAPRPRPRLPRALLGPLALVPLPDLAPARALAVRGPPLALASRPARPRSGSSACRRDADRRARLPRLHADRDTQHTRLRPHGRGRALARPRGRVRVRDHRRLVPAPHGAHARRHDARARPRRLRRPARRRAAHRRRLDGRRRGGSTWSTSATATQRKAARRADAPSAPPSHYDRTHALSRSSSSTSTAPSSTPAGSSSPRCGTRRGPCSRARSRTRS